jgi:hypothetical protein
MCAMTTFERLFRELDSAGLWRGTPIRYQIVASTRATEDNAIWFGGGVWRADGEDLADGDVEMWLSEMTRSLAECGVQLEVATVRRPLDEQSTGYTVRINGRDVVLYDFDPE